MQVCDCIVKDAQDKLKSGKADRKEVLDLLKELFPKQSLSGSCSNCGRELELAYGLKEYFWNCFDCFPKFRKILPIDVRR